MKTPTHAVSLFSIERGWKQARNRMWSSRSYGAVFIICSLNPSSRRARQSWVSESNWKTKPFSSLSKLHLWKQRVKVPSQTACAALSPGSALFHWMSQFLIDVFSKALLVQSLPVLVLFREITNCSANPSQSSHFKHLKNLPSELLQGTWATKYDNFDDCSSFLTCIKKRSLTSDPIHADVCTLGFWLLGRNWRLSEGKGRCYCQSLPPVPQMSRLKAFMRRSRSPMFAAWKSSAWSIMDKAILRAAQMFPDITWWDCWRLRLFLWRLKAVRKLLAASLGKRQ